MSALGSGCACPTAFIAFCPQWRIQCIRVHWRVPARTPPADGGGGEGPCGTPTHVAPNDPPRCADHFEVCAIGGVYCLCGGGLRGGEFDFRLASLGWPITRSPFPDPPPTPSGGFNDPPPPRAQTCFRPSFGCKQRRLTRGHPSIPLAVHSISRESRTSKSTPLWSVLFRGLEGLPGVATSGGGSKGQVWPRKAGGSTHLGRWRTCWPG